MGDQKDIADMSFEEFFSESKRDAERKENKKAAAQGSQDKPAGTRGFIGATPKINFNNGKFLLYVPRYQGLENDQFNVAVESGDRIVPMGRLDSSKQRGGRATKPSTIDLSPADVTPMDDFIITLDGVKAFENRAHPVSFYNNIGSPIARPIGEVTAVCREGTRLKLSKADIVSSSVKNGLAVYQVSVYMSGSILVDTNASAEPAPQEEPEQAPVEEKPAEPVKKPAKKAVKKPAVKGELSLSQPCADASIVFDSETYPLYQAAPALTVSVQGTEPSECAIHAEGRSGPLLDAEVSPVCRIDTGDYMGPVAVTLEKGGKKLASIRYFVIPGFECAYSGKGDITEDTTVSYTINGQSGTRDVFDEDPYTFEADGMSFKVVWCVPAVTYDIGSGPVRFSSPVEVDVMDLKGEDMVITVRGARKKALFISAESGKKRDITPEWVGETYRVPLEPVRDEILSHPSTTYNMFITVNSFPNRKFMTVTNPVRMKASFEAGEVIADIDPSMTGCVCRLYRMDKSVDEVPLQAGSNRVPVQADVIEAEVAEIHNGEVRTSIPVKVRDIPFIVTDAMGDKWMYVSRSKRIPLPTDLYADGVPSMPAIKPWHERIVRMNPELKGVTFEMIQKAFKEAR